MLPLSIRNDPRSLTVRSVAASVGPVFAAWPIKRAWLYGSVARGEQHVESDVDIAYEPLPDARIGWGVWNLQQQLEEALGVEVDVKTTPDAQRAHAAFLEEFERDKVMVYERPQQ